MLRTRPNQTKSTFEQRLAQEAHLVAVGTESFRDPAAGARVARELSSEVTDFAASARAR